MFFCYIMLGCFSGLIFSLLFINFDKSWKKILSTITIVIIDGAGGIGLYHLFEIAIVNKILISIGLMLASFIITFIIVMFVIARIIQDKDDKNIIRIRDIFLGQKSYIDRYYNQRQNEITDKIIPGLEEREQDIKQKEYVIQEKMNYIQDEMTKLEKLGIKKPKIVLPNNKQVVVTKEYLEILPAYIEEFSIFLNDLNIITNELLEEIEQKKELSLGDFRAYLLDISIHLNKDVFKGNDVRIHFRRYDPQNDGYRMLISIKGEKELDKDMTFIPYNKESMIKKSSECRRALLKSLNPEYDYKANNFSLWQDYISFAFYNIKLNERVCLTFGISVKNAMRYKNLLHFLSYINFESYLQEYIEKINDAYKITEVLYKD